LLFSSSSVSSARSDQNRKQQQQQASTMAFNHNESKQQKSFTTGFILMCCCLMAIGSFSSHLLATYYGTISFVNTAELLNNAAHSSGIAVATPDSSLSFNKNCTCRMPTTNWTAQAGQDQYLLHRVFFQQGLCCRGTFVEFGARNGIADSNTYRFEKDMGWTGLMFELDPNELTDLKHNRPGAVILHGPVCPSTMSNVTIGLSRLPGWTGAADSMGKY
jgi:hypothetical protein